jgi:hypothetical protein
MQMEAADVTHPKEEKDKVIIWNSFSPTKY